MASISKLEKNGTYLKVKDKKKFYINGEWVKPHKSNDLEVINPSNEEVCAVISIGGIEDTNKAVAVMGKVVQIAKSLGLELKDQALEMLGK